jgi:hypothetical protein
MNLESTAIFSARQLRLLSESLQIEDCDSLFVPVGFLCSCGWMSRKFPLEDDGKTAAKKFAFASQMTAIGRKSSKAGTNLGICVGS